MFSLFSQAHAGANLTPGQRAFLKLVQGFVLAGIVAAVPIFSLAMAQQSVDWGQVLRNAASAFAVAFLLALYKFASAQGDAPLAQVAQGLATAIEEHVETPATNPMPFSSPPAATSTSTTTPA